MASFRKHAEAHGISVLRADALLSDTAALDELLKPLPEAEELRTRLAAEFFARAWDAQTMRDYWVVSDGHRVTCFTVCGLTLKQAAAVRVRWDALRTRPPLTQALLADVIASETGGLVTLVTG